MYSLISPISRRRTLGLAATLACLAPFGALRAQQKFPSKPVRLVVGFPPGGGADVMARAFQIQLGEELGQPVVIDNKPGASASIGAADVAHAPPDGYSIYFGPTSVETANPYLFKATVNPAKEMAPLVGVARVQLVLVARNGLPAKDLKELVDYARANPGKLTYGSSGAGTSPHLAMELFLRQAGIQVLHVPYKGAAACVQALLAGEIDLVLDPGVSFQHVQAGKLRILAVPSDHSPPMFPNVPTTAEAGIPKAEFDTWMGLWIPLGTPPDIVARLRSAMMATLKLPAVQKGFTTINTEVVFVDTPDFAKLLTEEGRTLSGLIRERKIVAD